MLRFSVVGTEIASNTTDRQCSIQQPKTRRERDETDRICSGNGGGLCCNPVGLGPGRG
ncbi:MAG: ST-I family heat-stable enterotoxin [Deltaproteobacteria bacterium]|nr:ST-I family heat-stable enterotoxin [Deltaproteobacteria bacterium]